MIFVSTCCRSICWTHQVPPVGVIGWAYTLISALGVLDATIMVADAEIGVRNSWIWYDIGQIFFITTERLIIFWNRWYPHKIIKSPPTHTHTHTSDKNLSDRQNLFCMNHYLIGLLDYYQFWARSENFDFLRGYVSKIIPHLYENVMPLVINRYRKWEASFRTVKVEVRIIALSFSRCSFRKRSLRPITCLDPPSYLMNHWPFRPVNRWWLSCWQFWIFIWEDMGAHSKMFV